MSSEIEAACKYAIGQTKKARLSEVTPDELLLGCFRTVSQFGIVQLGPWTFDLEELGMDWLAYGEEKGHKVSYSQAVVDLLDRATQVARAGGFSTVHVTDLLAAYASSPEGLMGKLKRAHSITSAQWRAAIADLTSRSRDTFADRLAPSSTAPAVREYLTPEEAADLLSIHVQTLRGHVRSGKLPALRLAGERAIRIRKADLEKVFEPAVQAD